MSEDKEEKGPDYTLKNAKVKKSGGEPRIYAVVDLKAYLKPEMDEELSQPDGEPTDYGTETVCDCVPVEDCACNIVSYFDDTCSCVGNPTGGGSLYWYPY